MRSLIRVHPDNEFASYFLEIARIVRNEVSEYMTSNTSYISMKEQADWFCSLDHENFKIYLYLVNYVVIGYGIVRTADDCVLLTGALLEAHRGKGFGRDLFEKLISEAREFDKRIVLDVRETNEPARRLYENLGFIEIAREHGIITMELK